MKTYFWLGLFGLLLFEIANVYFIMPMPGSQQLNSVDLAYFLYTWRWLFRLTFAVLIIIGLLKSSWRRRWVPAAFMLLLAAITYITNFQMAADAMFLQPKKLIFSTAAGNKIDSNRLVIGVVLNGEAKAYPVQLIGYHHHIQDTVGGTAVLVTYCTVCRTGRVFEPLVDGKKETFRLVGMDHFNAMLEDETTKSWWRQSTGTAITGKRKGMQLRELLSHQTSLHTWLRLYPGTRIMQPDPAFASRYDSTFRFEAGTSKSKLTGTDSSSWQLKSWVVGVKTVDGSKAYDWNLLKQRRLITDTIGTIPILLVLAADDKSFFAMERPAANSIFTLRNDTLFYYNRRFTIAGKGVDTSLSLHPLPAYQEFWHSWQSFHPATAGYRGK